MNLSLGEYRSLVAKAFRGAGYSWGLTEEAAFAAKRLAESGLPTAEIVTALLRSVDGMRTADVMPDAAWNSTSGTLCPVCVGTAIADRGGCESLTLGSILEPVLIAPFLLSTFESESTGGYLIDWTTGHCAVTSRGVRLHGERSTGAVSITIRSAEMHSDDAAVFTRVDLDPDTVEALEGFAHRTYAPATEQSRNAGAG